MRRLYGIPILLVVIFLFFLPSLFLQNNSIKLLREYRQTLLSASARQDNLHLIYTPFRKFYYDQLHNGRVPFWDPYIYGGAPFFADDQSAVLSLYNMVDLSFPFNSGLLVASILKLIVTGMGMYLLLDLLSLNIYACLLGSITWMFSAFMMTFHIHHTASEAGSFIPWFFYFFERLARNVENGRRIATVLSGLIISVGLSLLSGHAETTIVGSIGLVFYMSARAAAIRPRTDTAGGGAAGPSIRARTILYTLAGLTAGYLLASVQLIPFLDVILKSEPYYLRSTSIHVLRSMPLWTVIMWVAPTFYFLKEGGTAILHQSTTYIGITSLVLAAFSIFTIRRHNRAVLPFLITMIVTTGIGYVIPPFSWLLGIPVIRLGGAFRFIAVTEFSLSVLAGFGMNAIDGRYGRSAPTHSNTLTAIAVALTLFAVSFIVASKFDMLPSLATINDKLLWLKGFSPISIGISGTTIAGLTIFMLAVLFILFECGHIRTIAGVCLLTLSVADLFIYGIFGMGYNPLLTSDSLKPANPVIETLTAVSSGDYTFYTNTGLIKPNIGLIYGLRDFRGFDIVVSKRYQNFLSMLFFGNAPRPDASGEYHDLPGLPDPVIAGMAGIKYLILGPSADPGGAAGIPSTSAAITQPDSAYYRPVRSYDGTTLWENVHAKPLIYPALAVQSVATDRQALAVLSSHGKQLLHTSIVMGIDDQGSLDASKIRLSRTVDVPGHHVIRVQAGTNGFLVINEPYYPGWHASIDGREVRMYHVNYLFQGIKLPKGKYTVDVAYTPKMFYLGLTVSALVLLATTVMAII